MDQKNCCNNLHDSITESSTSNSQTIVTHDDRMAQNGWSSSRTVVSLDLNVTQIQNQPFASFDDSDGDPMDDGDDSLVDGRISSRTVVSLDLNLTQIQNQPSASYDDSDDGDNSLVDGRISCKIESIDENVGQPQAVVSTRFKIPRSISSGLELTMMGCTPYASGRSYHLRLNLPNLSNLQDSLSNNRDLFRATNVALDRHPFSQYSRRVSEFINRSLSSPSGSDVGHYSSSTHRYVPYSTSHEGVLPFGGVGRHRHNQTSSRSYEWVERQLDGGNGSSYSRRALSNASEGRSRRMIEEIGSVLGMMYGRESLQFEDVMVTDPSAIFEMADFPDQHRDMRLDVDNMSYEELLALGERIGSVSTGLSSKTVTSQMKRRKYFAMARNDQAETEPCCICQEEFKDGDELGMLDCDHDFHTECIKQWLEQKNMCPICKTTALLVKLG